MKKTITIILYLASLPLHATEPTATDSTSTISSHFGVDVRGGYAFSSHDNVMELLPDDDRKETHSAISAHLKYSFSLNNKKSRYPGVYQGIGVGITTFNDARNVGTPVSVYVFQGAPIVNFSDRLSLFYEWNFGASMGWKKSDGEEIYSNLTVGSRANAYLNVGFMLRYRLNSRFSLMAGIDLSHYSNGNTSWPNPGVNTAGARIGLVYTPQGEQQDISTPFRRSLSFRPGFSYDLTMYGAWRKGIFSSKSSDYYTPDEDLVMLPGHFGVAGMNFAPMYDIRHFFRAGVSADIQWDESSNLNKYRIDGTSGDYIKFTRPPFYKQVSAGLSARAELVMPIFSINAGIGYNFLGPEETRKCYQMLTLKTYLTSSLFLNVGYQLHEFSKPSNLMLGVGYTFNAKR